MKMDIATRVERFSVLQFALVAIFWVLGFAVVYALVPDEVALRNSSGEKLKSFTDTLYFSVVTASTLGDSSAFVVGWLRAVVALEVIGGIVIAGLTVNSIVAIPSRQLRLAARACSGWWLESITFPSRQPFYSFTHMALNGGVLTKRGSNFDPSGRMHKTTYQGVIITESFPILFSLYENDTASKDFSEGILKFQMLPNSDGRYLEYHGSSYDKKGRRDQIIGHRILNKTLLKKLDDGCISEDDMKVAISELFA
jgi:Ion channel